MPLTDHLQRDTGLTIEVAIADDYADLPAHSKSLNAAVVSTVRDAFLSLEPSVAEHRAILDSIGANGYVPAGRSDFNEVRGAVSQTRLMSGVDNT